MKLSILLSYLGSLSEIAYFNQRLEVNLLEINPTYYSPHVVLNPINGHLTFSGRSVLTDVSGFYEPILNWVHDLTSDNERKIEISFDLEYFNLASYKQILFLFYQLKMSSDSKDRFLVKWFYQSGDADNLERAMDLSVVTGIPFEFISY